MRSTAAAPSGAALPAVLREKLRLLQRPTKAVSQPARQDRDQVFSARELESELWKTSQAIVSVQKQISRGEELYHEDTQGYGNLFKGWEGLVDARDLFLGSSMNSGSSNHGPGARRMPNDHKWMSGSSVSAASGRHLQPKLMTTRVTAATAKLVPVTLAGAMAKSPSSENEAGTSGPPDVSASKSAITAAALPKEDQKAPAEPKASKRKASEEESKPAAETSSKSEQQPTRRTKRRRRT